MGAVKLWGDCLCAHLRLRRSVVCPTKPPCYAGSREKVADFCEQSSWCISSVVGASGLKPLSSINLKSQNYVHPSFMLNKTYIWIVCLKADSSIHSSTCRHLKRGWNVYLFCYKPVFNGQWCNDLETNNFFNNDSEWLLVITVNITDYN